MEKFFLYTKSFVLYALLFLFPLFFLPVTQEYFVTNKMYLLAFGSLTLILISTLELLVTKKLVWQKKPFDNLVILLFLTTGLSIVISSPNKIQALLNPTFGLVSVLSLTILYFYLSRSQITRIESARSVSLKVISASSALLSLITIVFFFQPFKNASLPQSLQFLKNPAFTPMGSQLDLAIFLGFFVIYGLARILGQIDTDSQSRGKTIFNFSFLIFNLIALSLTIFSIIKNPTSSIQLPPFRLSWYAAIETLKNPQTALFGVGVDNFASIFTRIKDFTFNQSSFWQIGSFAVSRSTLLHLFTETGLFGLIALSLLLISLIREGVKKGGSNLKMPALSEVEGKQFNNFPFSPFILYTSYFILVLLFFPPSLLLFFLLYVLAASTNSTDSQPISTNLTDSKPIPNRFQTDFKPVTVDLSDLVPIYLGAMTFSLLIVGVLSYFLGRAYLAEYYFKKSFNAYITNNAKELYDNQRQAILLNPYLEIYRLNFSQTNLIIANNLSSKNRSQITDADRQTIAQAVQAAIAEAKSVVALNPQKAISWVNLASIYRNIINVVQGADVWAISSYQRAIILDPQNPNYRLYLGGVYFTLGNFDEAVKFFEQSVSLKPDWPNAHYNLAWAAYQKGNYKLAVNEMQNILTLINPTRDEADYKKASADLEEFKKKLPEGEEATGSATQNPAQLTLPTPPQTQIEPKLKLPKEASPEAK